MQTPAFRKSSQDFYSGLLDSWLFLAEIAHKGGRRTEANYRDEQAAYCLHQVMHHGDGQPEM